MLDWKVKRLFWRTWHKFERWAQDHEIVICFLCSLPNFKKNIKTEQTLQEKFCPLCPKCHEKWFGDE